MKNYLLYFLGCFLLLQACKKNELESLETRSNKSPQANASYVPDNSVKVVAYFPSYRDPSKVSAENYKLVTHLFYAFLGCNTNGDLLAVPNVSRFNSVIATARANGAKVGISVNGPANLKIVAADSIKRKRLVNNLVNFVLANNLDGLDMDWEYPRSNDGTDVSYAALMKELSAALHAQNKFLSTAITAGVYSGAVRDGIKTEVFGYADFFNIMTYDGLNWDSQNRDQHASLRMCETSLNYWVNQRGMPREKAVVGIPAYGRSRTISTSLAYRDLVAAGADPAADFFTVNGHLYGYTGTASAFAKGALARQRANGVMLWEFYGDTQGSESLLLSANTGLTPLPAAGIFETFSADMGRFNRQPIYSGTTVGIDSSSASEYYVNGSSAQLRVMLKDNKSNSPWFVRLLSGDGLPANNVLTAKTGSLYFYMKTTHGEPGGTVRIWVDDSDGTEQSAPINIINDGEWHKYSWPLASGTGWTPAEGGNGSITAFGVTLDAIIFEMPQSSKNKTKKLTAYIDDVGN